MKRATIPAGTDYMKSNFPKVNLSPLGIDVANILAYVMGGLHHSDPKEMKRVEWSDTHSMAYRWYHEVATWDGWQLTALVLLAHDRNVRVSIRSCPTRNHIEIRFMRNTLAGAYGQVAHPTMEEHVARIREYYGHEIVDRPRPEAEA